MIVFHILIGYEREGNEELGGLISEGLADFDRGRENYLLGVLDYPAHNYLGLTGFSDKAVVVALRVLYPETALLELSK